MQRGFLLLADGTIYVGSIFGFLQNDSTLSRGVSPQVYLESPPMGELVFNTGMTGYQEIITDPSYRGQLVVMTSPHIGNYGVDSDWAESNPATGAFGLICKEYYDGPLPFQRTALSDYMKELGISGISGVDTRALTLHLRDKGSQNGIIWSCSGQDPTESEITEAKLRLASCPDMAGCSLIDEVGVPAVTHISLSMEGERVKKATTLTLAILDCGIKQNIVREFLLRNQDEQNQRVRINPILFPPNATWEEIIKYNPDGIFLSNGPGDPGVLHHQVDLAKRAIAEGIPLTGICLGHQIIAQALGAETFKMKFGHHGCNHPVRDEESKRVFVTSQNHGFAVRPESLPSDVKVWFTNTNDNSIEGLKHKTKPICSVQFHPEAAPGPLDASWIFNAFISCIRGDS